MDGKLISPERTEAERNLASHCEKQSANHKPAYDQVCVTAGVGHPPLEISPCCHQALLEAGRVSVALVLPWAVNKLSQSRLTACVLNELPLCAADQHHLCLASKLGNRRRQNTVSSPKTVFVNSLITHPDSMSHQQLTNPQETGNGCHLSSRKRSSFCP